MMRRWCLALDLKDDAELITEYCRLHEEIWPEIAASIREAGIVDMEIWRTGNRLTLIMEADERFDPSTKAIADAANPRVAEWESLMWRYQQALPWAAPGQKWVEMDRIFQLNR